MQEMHQQTWPVLSSVDEEDYAEEVYREDEKMWRVRDVIAHLADSERGLLGQVKRLIAGEQTVPEDFDLNHWNRSAVRKTANVAVPELLEQISSAYEETLQVLNELDDAVLDQVGRHSSGRMLTVEGFFRRVLSHRSEHVADIQKALTRGE
jgi:hypothetical protein